MSNQLLTQLADALDCFWNPACEAISRASYHGPASGNDVIGAMAQGLAAVATRLREQAATSNEPPVSAAERKEIYDSNLGSLPAIGQIPAGVIYAPEHDNFYSASYGHGMGSEFHTQWASRSDEFPKTTKKEVYDGKRWVLPGSDTPIGQRAAEGVIRDVIGQLRAYNPQADEYKGAHIHAGWAKQLEAALPMRADPPSQGIPGNVLTHRNAWRKALVAARDAAEVSPPDVDDRAYWEHEIQAFDRTFDRLGELVCQSDVSPGAQVQGRPEIADVMDRCIRELRSFVDVAHDYDLDEMAVQALETAIESMELRKQPAQGIGIDDVLAMMGAGATLQELADWLIDQRDAEIRGEL